MRRVARKVRLSLSAIALLAVLAVPAVLAADKAQTFTGEVGDAMCGAKHEMAGDAADCTVECIKMGSKYALISGDKVYTLETKDKTALDQLAKLAGKKAKVTGSADGTTINVSAVAPGQ